MDYFYAKVEQVADDLEAGHLHGDPDDEIYESLKHPLRTRLARIMRDLAGVLHDIEWSDSGDRMPDARIPARRFVERFQEDERRQIDAEADDDVLAYAVRHARAVMTLNRKHFINLQRRKPGQAGIIVCTFDRNFVAQAKRIHEAIKSESELTSKLIRVNRG